MFEGIITPIVTPFYRDTDQGLNKEALEQLIERLIDEGVSGIFVLGSNGEFHVLDHDEKLEVVRETVRIVNGRVPVYAGAGACGTKETIKLAKEMEEAGADALSIIAPYFLKPRDEELYSHFKAVADSVNIPIILYNIPKATGCPIPADVVEKLADHPNVAAIKDSSGNMETLKAYADIAKKKDFKLLVGSDSKISAAYGLGASGAVAGTSNVIPEVLVKLDKALRNGDTEMAKKLQDDIDVLRGVLPCGTVPSIMKRACELRGIAPVGPARRPVLEPDRSVDESIQRMLAYYEN